MTEHEAMECVINSMSERRRDELCMVWLEHGRYPYDVDPDTGLPDSDDHFYGETYQVVEDAMRNSDWLTEEEWSQYQRLVLGE